MVAGPERGDSVDSLTTVTPPDIGSGLDSPERNGVMSHVSVLRRSSAAASISSDKTMDYMNLTDEAGMSDAGQSAISERARLWIFLCFFCAEVLINYESGALPASLSAISNDFHLSYVAQGALGSLVYIGFVVSSLVAGHSLQDYKPGTLLGGSMLLNAGFTVMFALAPNPWLLYCGRFCVGVSQVTVVVYAPVWVDHHAPQGKATLWMCVVQAGCPTGVVIGYLVAGLTAEIDTVVLEPWRLAFLVQATLLVPLAIVMYFLPSAYISVDTLSQAGTPDQTTPIIGGSSSRLVGPETTSVAVAAK
eukprot:GFYU01019179.1.p1 GENE.GFYU01019179.1~~GFYU01019179.1.p1  ORF type:complete len:305 (+),score=58.82 GFYU01019179.1:284-1198(+)